jgi:tetratricopeptide (TPR) repeat protein/DNA-binding CsgD family transcriptional regulator
MRVYFHLRVTHQQITMNCTIFYQKMSYVILLLLVSLFTNLAFAQGYDKDSLKQVLLNEIDLTERIKTLHELTGVYFRFDADSTLIFAQAAFALTENGQVDSLHGQSITNLVGAYFGKNEIDSAKVLLLSSLEFHQKREDYKMIATTYRNLAVIGENKKEPDSSLYYLDLCMNVLAEYPDSILLGDALYSRSFAYQTKGYYDLAVESILEASRIFEKLDRQFQLGFMYHMLNTNFSHMKKYHEAIEWNNKCIEIWEKDNYTNALIHAYNNMGIDCGKVGQVEKSKSYHIKANQLCKELNQDYVQMLSAFNLAELYYSEGDLDSTLVWLEEVEPLAKEQETHYIIGGANVLRAKLGLARGRTNNQLYIKNVINELSNQEDPHEKLMLIEGLAEIYEQSGMTNQALMRWKEAKILEDSLFTIDKNKKFEELNLIYNTEKKDAEIKLLNKTVELDQTRKKALITGLILLLVAAGSVVYTLIQRSRKNKKIFEQEKQIEIEKRRATERELEFKQKELTAKVLQLASKNEFLQSLEHEVSELKSSVDATVSKTTQRISRMISYDASDDQEWEQFGREFSSIHQDFIDRLNNEFGSLSKSELRLITLLKMNLSSKDIANTLRISDDGVKKARYRLRKKMNLDSDIDIQEYVLNY